MDRAVIATGREILLKSLDDTKSAFKPFGSAGEDFAQELRNVCKQLSQLVAWMWCPEKITSNTIDPTQEKQLKKAFDALLKYQAFKNNVDGSNAIADLLLGKKGSESEYIKKVYTGPIPDDINLPKIYADITNNQAEYAFTQEYLDNFYTEVDVNTFNGDVSYDFFGKYNPTGEPKFIVRIGFPPRPELGEFTVSPAELKGWATDPSNYEPPNPYITVSASC